MKLIYTVLPKDNFFNIKELLKTKFEISDRLLLKLKNNKKIFLNNNVTSVNSKLKSGDTIQVFIDFREDNSNVLPNPNILLNIIYEDDCYLIVNKPAGIPVHPSLNYYENSLSNGVRHYFDTIDLKKKIRPVNRLDKDTSGIVVFAKNEYIQECLIKQMKNNTFYKEYIAICNGIFEKKSGTINASIARKDGSIIEREINIYGDTAITDYTVLKEFDNISEVLCVLKTGRTHQIRVHMNYIGHSILGDTLYGTKSNVINRQALHSYKTSFIHPISREKVEYIANIPEDMKKVLYS